MRLSRPLLLAGAVALVAGVAVAEKPVVHVMKVALPDGSVQEVRYTGNTPPRIVVAEDPFAALDRMSAAMDAQMAAMMRQTQAHVQAMQRAAMAAPAGQGGNGVVMTGLGTAPAGTQFSYVSSTTVNGKTCTTSVRQVAGKAGEQPQMFRQVSGDGCSAAVQKPLGLIPTAAPAAPRAPLAPAAAKAPVAPVAPRAPTVPRDTI